MSSQPTISLASTAPRRRPLTCSSTCSVSPHVAPVHGGRARPRLHIWLQHPDGYTVGDWPESLRLVATFDLSSPVFRCLIVILKSATSALAAGAVQHVDVQRLALSSLPTNVTRRRDPETSHRGQAVYRLHLYPVNDLERRERPPALPGGARLRAYRYLPTDGRG